ncbi:MAG: hypothetical protein K0R67_3001, partial [Paenibacillus sp.]|nr:hypothetical protein [Paenibacillus sp.]
MSMNPLVAESEASQCEIRTYVDKWTVMRNSASSDDPQSSSFNPVQRTGFVTAFYNAPTAWETRFQLVMDQNNLCLELDSDQDIVPQPESEMLFIVLANSAVRDVFYSIPIVVTRGPHPYVINYTNWTGGEPLDRNQTCITLREAAGVYVTVEQKSGAEGWKVKVSVPLAALNVSHITAGVEWMVNVIRYCGPDSQVPLSSWVPIRTGTIRMDDVTRPLAERLFRLDLYVANEGRLGTVFVGESPGAELFSTAKLLHRGITEKTLILECVEGIRGFDQGQLSASWLDPRGRATVLSLSNSAWQGNLWSMDITHPAPLVEGMYQ